MLNPFEVLAAEHLAQMERTSGNGHIYTNYPCQKEIRPSEHTRAVSTGMSILWKCLLTGFVSLLVDGGFSGYS